MPAILERLTNQIIAKGKSPSEARAIAVESLQKNGILHPGTEQLTAYGHTRNSMTPAERAKDRAAKQSGNHSPGDYTYNHKTNQATLKR